MQNLFLIALKESFYCLDPVGLFITERGSIGATVINLHILRKKYWEKSEQNRKIASKL